MDFRTGMIILGETALLGAVIFCALHEKKLRAAERAAAKKIRARLKAFYRSRTRARMEKINRKAVYTPVKPPEKPAKEQQISA